MDTHHVKNFLLLLQELQAINSEFPLQYAICMAEIALNEGLSLTELSQKTGLALPTVSRIISALSTPKKKGNPYDMVNVRISAHEKRRKELSLTPKGKSTINAIAQIMTA